MSVLAFDTATPATAVALLGADCAASEVRDDPGPGARPRHTDVLALAVDLLERMGGDWGTVRRVAVDVGPGGFTGLRVGIATARALAQSRGCEIVGVGSLAALAHGASLDGWEHVLAVLDARRGEVFAAAYECPPSSSPRELEAPAVMAPEALGELLSRVRTRIGDERAILAAGDGAVRYPDPLALSGAVVPPPQSSLHQIRAASVCALGSEQHPPADYESIVPEYLRRPDAELTLEATKAGAGGRR